MPAQVDLYSDVHCPYAYLTVYRLRRILPEYEGRVEVRHRALAIEYDTRQSTPKPILDHETPFILLEEPEIPYQPWAAPESTWPVTMWPAFEAIECARLQSSGATTREGRGPAGDAFATREGRGPAGDPAAELDWAIRRAFFAESRCISMRFVLLELAEAVGLEMERFTSDFDAGRGRGQAVQDTRHGWGELDLQVSPTFVLANGEQFANPGNLKVVMDPDRHHKVTRVVPAGEPQGEEAIRRILDRALDL